MKTLYVEINFPDDEEKAISRVSQALEEFEINHLSWKRDETKINLPHYRAAATIKNALDNG